MASRKLMLGVVLAVAALAAADALCSGPIQFPGTQTCSPNPIGCTCLNELDYPFDPAVPLGASCPACPNVPETCPDLVAPAGKQYVCRGKKLKLINVRRESDEDEIDEDDGDFKPSPATCCGCDKKLCKKRRATLTTLQNSGQIFAGVNFNDPVARASAYQAYTQTLTSIMAENCTTYIQGIGVFGPRLLSVEYYVITTPFAGDTILNQYGQSYGLSYEKQGLRIGGRQCQRIRFNVPNFINYTTTMYDGTIYFTFLEGSALITKIEQVPACFLRNPAGPPSPDQINQICGTLDQVCQNIPTYEFRNNILGCINLWSNLAIKQSQIIGGNCNYKFPGTANTSQCRQVHFISSLVDPAVHCQHTNTISATCFDTAEDDPGASCPFREIVPPLASSSASASSATEGSSSSNSGTSVAIGVGSGVGVVAVAAVVAFVIKRRKPNIDSQNKLSSEVELQQDHQMFQRSVQLQPQITDHPNLALPSAMSLGVVEAVYNEDAKVFATN